MPQRHKGHNYHHHHNHSHHDPYQGSKMRIILDDNDIYLAGQAVCGTAVVDLESDVPLADCAITLTGVANISWTEQPGLRDEGHCYNVHRKLLEIAYDLRDCMFMAEGRSTKTNDQIIAFLQTPK